MTTTRCPCHSGQVYETCCQPLHYGSPAPTAERLMRSRYSAYSLKNADYLLRSWHTSTRPIMLTIADFQGIKWLGLKIIDTNSQDSQNATVTFKAKFRSYNQKTQILHEVSHFLFESDHWYYLSGKLLS